MKKIEPSTIETVVACSIFLLGILVAVICLAGCTITSPNTGFKYQMDERVLQWAAEQFVEKTVDK